MEANVATDTLHSLRAALYARVSTHNGQNPDMQLAELRQYAACRSWTITQEYVDLVLRNTWISVFRARKIPGQHSIN